MSEKRRSDRLLLTIPLEVGGKDPEGAPFKDEARTISVNRHGACIRIAHRLHNGQSLRVVNKVSGVQSEFRVVGPVAPPDERGGEWGVESVNLDKNIWGIYFPPLPKQNAPEGTALLECRKCHTVAVLRLTLVEGDVLETAGILSKSCEVCKDTTSWGFVKKRVEMGLQDLPGLDATPSGTAARRAERRRYPRAAVQLPVRIRDYYGAIDLAKTRNISKGGFCFISAKEYLLGQGIVAICPYDDLAPGVEAGGHVVHRQPLEVGKHTMYGVRYDAPAK